MTDIDQQIRERVAALPDASLHLDGYLIGECAVALVDADLPGEHVVVLIASDFVEADPELVDGWVAGASPHVAVDGDRFTFGTAGAGEGVVAYEVAARPVSGPLVLRRVA